MGPFIITLIVLCFFSLYLGIIYLSDLVYIVTNLPIIWVVTLRSYFEIRHKKIFYPYVLALILTTIIHLIWFENIRPVMVWWPVWFITMMFVFAELINILIHYYKKYKKKN